MRKGLKIPFCFRSRCAVVEALWFLLLIDNLTGNNEHASSCRHQIEQQQKTTFTIGLLRELSENDLLERCSLSYEVISYIQINDVKTFCNKFSNFMWTILPSFYSVRYRPLELNKVSRNILYHSIHRPGKRSWCCSLFIT